MSNKEVIDYMNALQAKCENGYEANAINLAIKALEALENCTYFGEGLCLKCTHHILNNCPFYEEAENG